MLKIALSDLVATGSISVLQTYLVYYDITIKWPIKQCHNCDITIQWQQTVRPHAELHVVYITIYQLWWPIFFTYITGFPSICTWFLVAKIFMFRVWRKNIIHASSLNFALRNLFMPQPVRSTGGGGGGGVIGSSVHQ